jgi:O-antigen/teichoic acid export membrane protein
MRRFLALSFVQRGLMLAVYVGSTMILARLLTPEQVGIFSMTAAFISIAASVREFGMSEFLIQERDLDPPTIRAVYGVAILVGLAVGLVVLLCAPALARAYNEPQIEQIVYVLCLNFIILPFATPSMALLVREMSLARAWGVQSAAVVAQYAVSIALAWRGYGPISLAWGSVAASVTSVALLYALRPGEVRLLPTLTSSRRAWQYGTRFAATASLESAAKNAHEFIIPSAFGFAALGLYSRAAGLFEQFNQNVTRAVSRVLLPVFAQDARGGRTELKRVYAAATANFTCIAWPFFAFIALLADEIVLFLFGRQWTQAAPLLQLMCLAGMINAAHSFASDMLSGLGEIGAKLKIVSVTSPAWVVLCLAGAFVSIEAIALLSAGPALISLFLYISRLRALIGFSFRDLVESCARSAVVTTAVALAVSGAAWAPLPDSTWIRLTAAAAAAGLAWLLAVVATAHPLRAELRRALRAAAGR